MFSIFVPHLHVAAVQELTLERLRTMGIDALLLDADCTLKRYSCERCVPEAAAWLADVKAGGIGLCLVSNGWSDRIKRFAENVGLPFVARSLKPLPWGCRKALRKMGFDPAHTAMVGDQLFADVMAGRLSGITTILVDPIHPEEEPWFTRLKRRPERYLVRRIEA